MSLNFAIFRILLLFIFVLQSFLNVHKKEFEAQKGVRFNNSHRIKYKTCVFGMLLRKYFLQIFKQHRNYVGILPIFFLFSHL